MDLLLVVPWCVGMEAKIPFRSALFTSQRDVIKPFTKKSKCYHLVFLEGNATQEKTASLSILAIQTITSRFALPPPMCCFYGDTTVLETHILKVYILSDIKLSVHTSLCFSAK